MTISFWAEHGTLADGRSVLIVPEGLKGRLEASKYWVKAEEKNRKKIKLKSETYSLDC